MEKAQQVARAGPREIMISTKNMKQGAESGLQVGQGYKVSKPTHSDRLPLAGSSSG